MAGSGRWGPWRVVALVGGPLVSLVPLLLDSWWGLTPPAWRLCGVAAWMVIWWLSEAVPIPVTALLPIPVMPLYGVAAQEPVAKSYAHPLIFLFLGGFFIAGAMQRWGLHRRVALHILRASGNNARTLIGGFMVACALLSMWISNTATAVMMFPVGLSIIEVIAEEVDEPSAQRFGIALMLGIAYGCSIGGVATLIGTPPNTLLAAFVADAYGVELSFAEWMAIGLPYSFVLLPLAWLWLTRVQYPVGGLQLRGVTAEIDDRLDELGPMTRGEKIAAAGFLCAAALWITRPWIARATGLAISDASVAMAVGLCLFVLPTSLKAGLFALDWQTARQTRWGVLLLFGGGLALASAFKSTGLSAAVGHAFSGLAGVNLWLIVAIMAATVLMLTELTSNTATTATLLPIIGAIAIAWGQNPLLFMVPVAIAASGAFMLPVATPPNAVVFGYGPLRIAHMVRAGVFLNALSIAVVVVLDMVLCRWVLGAEPGVLPPWAR